MRILQKINLRYRLKEAPVQFLQWLLSHSTDNRCLQKRRNQLMKLLNSVDDQIRRADAQARKTVIRNPNGSVQEIPVSVMKANPPWREMQNPLHDVPGMITQEEAQYYAWLGEYYLGLGEVIELGPWLGKSTLSILDGLIASGKFNDHKLHVYEDFVWRASFMNKYVPEQLKRKDGEDFLPVFLQMTSSLGDSIDANARAIQGQSWNSHLPLLEWNDKPVELLYVDCGKAFLENEAWFKIFSPFFIPDVTLIVMQDWRAFRKIPLNPFAHTRQFTDSKAGAMELLHELTHGDVATFIWRGGIDPHRPKTQGGAYSMDRR